MKQKRPKVLKSKTLTANVGCGKLYITLCYRDDDRYNEPPINEIWVEPAFKFKGDEDIQAYCVKSFLTPISRLLTFIVRRIDKDDREALLKQIHQHECPKRSVATAKSCVDGVARALLCEWEGHKIKHGRCYVCGTIFTTTKLKEAE